MPSLDKSPGDTLSLTGFAGNSPLNEPTEEFLPSIVMVPFFGTRPVQMILPERVPAAAGATVGGGGPGDGCASVFNAGATGFSIGGGGKFCCATPWGSGGGRKPARGGSSNAAFPGRSIVSRTETSFDCRA